MVDDDTVGSRLRRYRQLRGLGQRVVAERAGLTQGFLSMVESGRRNLNRERDIIALADVLGVSQAELTGGRQSEVPTTSAAVHEAVSAVHSAIMGVALPPQAVVLPLAQLHREVNATVALLNDGRYAQVVELLPTLLTQVHMALDTGGPHRAEILRLALRSHHAVCARALRGLGHDGLASLAVERAAVLVAELDDPLDHAIHEFFRVWSLWRHGPAVDESLATITTATADTLRPHLRTPEEFALYEALHLSAALSRARLHQGDAALTHLAEATAVASKGGGTVATDLMLTPTRLAMYATEVRSLLGRYDEAVEVGRQVVVPAGATTLERAEYHAVLAVGLARTSNRHTEVAVKHLVRAEQLTPLHMRNNPYVHQLVSRLLERPGSKAVASDLHSLAHRMGPSPHTAMAGC